MVVNVHLTPQHTQHTGYRNAVTPHTHTHTVECSTACSDDEHVSEGCAQELLIITQCGGWGCGGVGAENGVGGRGGLD